MVVILNLKKKKREREKQVSYILWEKEKKNFKDKMISTQKRPEISISLIYVQQISGTIAVEGNITRRIMENIERTCFFYFSFKMESLK